ncbi:MAG: hypothetical protein ACLFQV_05800 [Vulcanimicrobiota bacterium]
MDEQEIKFNIDDFGEPLGDENSQPQTGESPEESAEFKRKWNILKR